MAQVPTEIDLPIPAATGTRQSVRIEGLTPSRLYGIALRAVDEAGNVGPLNPPFSIRTSDPPPPPDDDPPEPIDDLAAVEPDTASILLRWTAPADAPAGGAAAYEMRIADGSVAGATIGGPRDGNQRPWTQIVDWAEKQGYQVVGPAMETWPGETTTEMRIAVRK